MWLRVNLRLLLVVVWDGLLRLFQESWPVTAAGAGIGRIVRISWHGRGPGGRNAPTSHRSSRSSGARQPEGYRRGLCEVDSTRRPRVQRTRHLTSPECKTGQSRAVV